MRSGSKKAIAASALACLGACLPVFACAARPGCGRLSLRCPRADSGLHVWGLPDHGAHHPVWRCVGRVPGAGGAGDARWALRCAGLCASMRAPAERGVGGLAVAFLGARIWWAVKCYRLLVCDTLSCLLELSGVRQHTSALMRTCMPPPFHTRTHNHTHSCVTHGHKDIQAHTHTHSRIMHAHKYTHARTQANNTHSAFASTLRHRHRRF